MSRRRSRQACIQALYGGEFGDETLKSKDKDFFFKGLNDKDQKFTLKLLKDLKDNKEEIDKLIEKYSLNWKKERISLVDLSILRLGIFEIFFCEDTPPLAALNEALELAKQFGGEKSRSFVNGILNQALKEKEKSV